MSATLGTELTDPAPSRRITTSTRSAAIRHALVCLDRSELSGACLPYARFIAESFGAKLTLLHVLPSPAAAQEPNRPDALGWEIAKREASNYLAQAKASLGVAVDVVATRLVQGSPARQIVAAGREPGIDLTILASRGEGGAGTSDLGSIAQHVLAFAAGSILLAQPLSAAQVPPRRILVALDGSLRSEAVLPIVIGLAHRHGAEVLLVHVVRDPTATGILFAPDDLHLATALAVRMQASAEAYLTGIRTRLLGDLAAVETLVVRRTEERQALLDIAAEHAAELIVVTAHGSTCSSGSVFGSVASYLLARSRLPVFVLQDMPRRLDEVEDAKAQRTAFGSRPPEAD